MKTEYVTGLSFKKLGSVRKEEDLRQVQIQGVDTERVPLHQALNYLGS